MPMKSASQVSRLLAPVAVVLAMLLAAPALAANKGELEQVERQMQADRERAAELEKSRAAAARDLARLRREAIAAAKRAQTHEARLAELEQTLKQLGAQEDAVHRALRNRQFEMAGTLGALERLSRNPPQVMFAFPGAPKRMVRSAILLRAALPRLRSDTQGLRDKLDELAEIRKKARLQLVSLGEETRSLEKERQRLAAVLRRKASLLKRTESETREIESRVRELASRADSIRELLAQIEAERRRRVAEEARRQRQDALAEKPKPRPRTSAPLSRPEGVRPFPKRGTITAPTSARVLQRYGQRNKRGVTARGITYATRPRAQVVAPFDGLVVFAHLYGTYGQILIIEHDGGYHTLLAGLDRLDTSTGQWVLAGEPVGAMGPATVDAFGETQGLYLELRRAGQPINPHRWVAQR